MINRIGLYEGFLFREQQGILVASKFVNRNQVELQGVIKYEKSSYDL